MGSPLLCCFGKLMATTRKALTPQQEVERLRSRLKHLTFQSRPTAYFDTGSPELNEVFGHPEHGIPWGRLIELSGFESHGKTAIALAMLAMAQSQGAYGILVDFENSYDPDWAAKRGVDTDKLYVFAPYVGTFGKEKVPRLSTAQEVCAEVESMMCQIYTKDPACHIFVVQDSIASMLPDVEAAMGLEDQNLRSKMALPTFLGGLLRRWVGLAQSYCATVLFINQVRHNPMAQFGDPTYCPGGNAPRFYCHIRARAGRSKGGKVMRKGKQVGIQGIIKNHKNKAGGVERSQCGYKIIFNGPTEFFSADELVKEDAV